MLMFLNTILSSLDATTNELLGTGSKLLDNVYSFFKTKIWPFLRDYRFIVFGLLVVLLICIIIIWALKHMPSRGRIVDIYNTTGEKQDKKKNKDMDIHDLPPEFYKRK